MKVLEDKKDVINEINSLNNYQGYVQWSHRPIDKEKDIFKDKEPLVSDESGFILEAHFCNDRESVMIRQINNNWHISKTDITNIPQEDTQKYLSDIENFPFYVKMAQIWKEESDPLCENMKVKKLKKVVFAGFEGEKS